MSEDQTVIAMLRVLVKPNVRQRSLLALYEAEHRTKGDNEILRVLLDAERASHAARQASAYASKQLARRSGGERRSRTRTLIAFGGLGAVVDLLNKDPEVTLGALLGIHDAAPETVTQWKVAGGKFLTQRQNAKRAKLSAP